MHLSKLFVGTLNLWLLALRPFLTMNRLEAPRIGGLGASGRAIFGNCLTCMGRETQNWAIWYYGTYLINFSYLRSCFSIKA